MFTRLKLFSVLLLALFTVSECADDLATSKWVREINNKEKIETTTEAKVDLSPTFDEENTLCVTENNTIGECVLYYLCDSDTKTIIADGSTIIDIRKGECPSYLEICCSHKAEAGNNNEPVSTTPAPYIPTGDNDQKIPYNDQIDPNHSNNIIPQGQCGWNDQLTFVFPNKEDLYYANYGEFPWMVALIRQANSSIWSQNNYMGGGTLIHPSVVITVAHKVDELEPEKIRVRAGEWDTQTTREIYKFQERNVKSLKIHDKYFRKSVYNDVALLFLESPFDLTNSPHIGTACLGRSLPPPGTVCYSMGWGTDFKEENFVHAAILKKVRLELVGANDCQMKLQKTRLGKFYKLHSSLTCAGGKLNVDTCTGDGGSSLVCQIDSRDKRTRYAVYGMVAYGINCGEENVPGVYVNVPNVVDWVDSEMKKTEYGITYTHNS